MTAPDSSIVAFVAVAVSPIGGARVHVGGGVAPRWRGQGIGQSLFAWQLERATELYREQAAGAEWRIEAGADSSVTDAIRIFERSGMSVFRHYFRMVASTAGAVPQPVSEFRVEDARSVDPAALFAANMEAFADHFAYPQRSFDEWAHHAIGSHAFRPDLSRIAYDGDNIASYVLAYDEASPEGFRLNQVGTRRPWRRRGLASSLLAEVLAASATAGKTTARLDVDATSLTGAVGVYERAGFKVSSRAVSYALTLAA